ncbi:DUF885 domain-containing protein [Fumia xinanensis]|uniref:DUF885 domain-containing protein n=1 Tax=Fumia xinanensis TaxID=2763659 RepID=A0A926E261_9FIRM|nr:DUF885 domain-containing protein [Fumia xinanensis]MBC8560269.1 DUF885 domain-containing protein [Fumia xinanensis]
MTKTRRFAAAAAAVALSLSMMSFTSAPSQAERFDEFVDALPSLMMSSQNLGVNSNFNDPAAFGFDETALLTLPYVPSRDLYREGAQEYDALLQALHEFDANKLTGSQQITYDTLEDYLNLNKALVPYAYQNNNYLGGYLSTQANLPMYLMQFTFNRKADLDSYFNLLQTAKATFVKYAENEQLRQDKGMGLTPAIMEAAIQQCKNFVSNSTDYLLESFDERIDRVAFLTGAEKASAKEKNKKLVQNDLVNAYRTLQRELESITVKTPDGGLAKQPDGRAYYEKLVQQKVGTTDGIEDIRLMLTEAMVKNYIGMFRSIWDNKDAERFTDENGNPVFTELTSAEELIAELYEASKADFPEVPMPNYRVEQVPASMSENYSPASYRTPKVDAAPTDPQVIKLNGAFDQSNYRTVAHESFPGHMYQYTFYQTMDFPAVRSLTEFAGSAEGWANYAEGYAMSYIPEKYRAGTDAMWYSEQYTRCVIGLLDIGIHYDGWSREEALKFLKERLSENMTLEASNAQYDLCLESPGNYLSYYAGGLYFEQMKTEAQEALGDGFDPVEFHRVLLQCGNTSFDVYQAQVQRYIAEAQGQNKAA